MLSNLIYWPVYITMLGTFLTLSLTSMPTPREKAIGLLITIVNALLYWKGWK